MSEKMIVVAFTAPKELKALLERWSEEQERSVSYVLRKLITKEAQRLAAEQKLIISQQTH
jgi:hypothetical protein